MQIITERLILHAATEELLRAELAFLRDADRQHTFEQALGVQLLAWPPLYNDEGTCTYSLEKLASNPGNIGWWQWYGLLRRGANPPLLVALAGFHGPPDEEGNAEIGYSVLESYQRKGIASEIVKALTDWAFNHSQVAKVTITTLDMPEFLPSTKVAMKCGYHFVGSRESDEGALLVYELEREEHMSAANHGS